MDSKESKQLKSFIKNAVIGLISLLTVAGCAMQPLQPTGKFTSTLDVPQTTDLLYQQAERCWERQQKPTADGIVAKLEPLEAGAEQLLTIHRAAAGSVNPQPFFVARIYPDQPTSIKVAERAYGYGLLGVEELNLTAQLQLWLKGQTACIPLAH